jgi:hypothetical protein
MRRARALSVLLSVATLAVGCGDDSSGPGSGITVDDLAGTWNATVFVFTNQSNTSERFDLIAEGGAASLTIDSGGAYSLVVLEPSGSSEITAGFAVVESGFLLVTDDARPGVTIAFGLNLSGSTLVLVTDEATFDFGDDGEPEPARLTMNLQAAAGTTVGDLAGTWDASVFRYISEPTETDTVDVIALGGSLTVAITPNGGYEVAVAESSEPPVLESGTIVISGSRLLLIADQAAGDLREFRYQLAGPDTLAMDADEDFDFDEDEIDERATLELVLERR